MGIEFVERDCETAIKLESRAMAEGLPSGQLLVNESVVSVELDGETVLLNLETGVYFGLDATGTEIWQLVTAGFHAEEIFRRLSEEFSVEPRELRADLRAFLAELLSMSLVRIAEI